MAKKTFKGIDKVFGQAEENINSESQTITKQEYKTTSAQYKYPVYKALKLYCAQHDVQVRDVLDIALRKFLKEEGMDIERS